MYGEKLVFELDNKFQMFVPSPVSKMVQTNKDHFQLLDEAQQKLQLFIKPIDEKRFEFSIN